MRHVVRRTPSNSESASCVSGRTSPSARSGCGATTGPSGLDRVQRIAGGDLQELRQQRPGVNLDRMSDGATAVEGRMNRAGESAMRFPATRHAVIGAREGPSAVRTPTAPSLR